MMRVLVSEALAPLLDEVVVPTDVEVKLLPEGGPIPGGDFLGILSLLTRPLGRDELGRLPNLRVIANCAVGYENVDLEAARFYGVSVSNTPGVLTSATAELTWALILATARRVTEGERLARSGHWMGWEPTQLLGTGLDGKVLGIVGAGRIGREVGRRAGAFGMLVVYWGRGRHEDWERVTGAEWRELRALLEESDVVSLHLPVTPQTERLIDARALERMKPSAILINTARGALVDEDALTAALERGRLRAAGLDVYAREPEIPPRLRSLRNAVLLPHIGSATEETRRAMFRLAWDNLMRGIRGEALLTPVLDARAGMDDPTAGDHG